MLGVTGVIQKDGTSTQAVPKASEFLTTQNKWYEVDYLAQDRIPIETHYTDDESRITSYSKIQDTSAVSLFVTSKDESYLQISIIVLLIFIFCIPLFMFRFFLRFRILKNSFYLCSVLA